MTSPPHLSHHVPPSSPLPPRPRALAYFPTVSLTDSSQNDPPVNQGVEEDLASLPPPSIRVWKRTSHPYLPRQS
eukprot:300467-Chlamydomonas_euryale.AAC.1